MQIRDEEVKNENQIRYSKKGNFYLRIVSNREDTELISFIYNKKDISNANLESMKWKRKDI